MDARHKAGHDSESLVSPGNDQQACVIARILCGPGQAVSSTVRLRPEGLGRDKPHNLEKSRGRAGRQGPGRTQVYAVCANKSARTHGPRRLAASRRAEVRTASPPFPRRPARDVYRFAPSRPWWTSHFRQPASPCELEGCLSTTMGPGRARHTCDRLPFPPSRGPAARGWRAGTRRLGPLAGVIAPHLQRPQPATASRPASEDA